MHKLLASIHKEFLLISRDLGGMLILFVMPLVLVITVTLIQDSSFQNANGINIPVALVDLDQGSVATKIIKELEGQESISIQKASDSIALKKKVNAGKYKLGIVIPKGLSYALDQKVEQNVNKVLTEFGMGKDKKKSVKKVADLDIKLYFDPTLSESFKKSIQDNIEKIVSQIETKSIYSSFKHNLALDDDIAFDTHNFLKFQEISTAKGGTTKPNSVQHNVPAWTLFAIFFIIVPLSINIVKEKNQGTFIRQRTQPISYLTILGGKSVIYLSISLIQFTLILLVALYLFPSLGLPPINVSGRLLNLYIVAFFAGLAAIGLGLLIGTFSKTSEQSAPFGATFVVIMAALGGIWVPVFVMPKVIQPIAKASPMNWGIEAFYHVFLRNSNLGEIMPYLGLLLMFSIITGLIAVLYNERKIHL